MIIIQIAGGLGNQMQQYSVYRKLLSMGKEVKLDLSWFNEDVQKNMLAKREFELPLFKGLPFEVCTDEERDRFLNLTPFQRFAGKIQKRFGQSDTSNPNVFEESKMYDDRIFKLEDKYVTGYFACQKYYGDIMPELRELFVFPENSDPEMEELNNELARKMDNENSVSVHIRRGDYLDPSNWMILGNIATEEYYEAAMRYFEEKYPDVHFYIFTSDHEYARKHYSDESKYTLVDWNTGKNSLYDLMLMSHCKGNICANSTFSFWGARLNGRPDHEVIRTYKMRNNQPVNPQIMHDYWKDWILMDNEGNIV